eukprot:scaffold106211_cov63-Phaeocystis_antarctica.AAC.1
MKLGAALGGRAGSALVHAVETWRRSCALLSTGQQLTAPSNDGALKVRVESMARMLEEQQQELADGYRLAATMKLSAAVGGRAGSALAHAVETWRCACALLSMGQQSASGEVEERAALSQQTQALEVKLAAGRKALASAEAAATEAKADAEAARQEVGVARGDEKAASLKMTQMAAQLATASQDGGSAATSLRTRVESMSRMLEEQQQELADGYHMAATMKLGAALGGRAGSALAHAVETWRRAGALLSTGQQLTAPSNDGALQVRVASLSRMLEQQQQELGDSYRLAATMKLSAAVGGRAGSGLAHAVETWRRACAVLSAGQQSASDEVAERAAQQ